MSDVMRNSQLFSKELRKRNTTTNITTLQSEALSKCRCSYIHVTVDMHILSQAYTHEHTHTAYTVYTNRYTLFLSMNYRIFLYSKKEMTCTLIREKEYCCFTQSSSTLI